MKLLSVIIVYNPDIELLRLNIAAFIDGVDALVLWNNTPTQSNVELAEQLALGDEVAAKVTYLGSSQNQLIAYPLNQVVALAKREEYTHLLTMDQDSRFSGDLFAQYRAEVQSYEGDSSMAIFGVNPNWQFTGGEPPKIREILNHHYTITSGSIYRVDMFDKIGGFREDFGIDGVDSEICYRASRAALRTVVVSDILLIQQFGTQQHIYGNISTDNYSAFRVYQIIKNHIIIWRMYPREFAPEKRGFVIYYILKRIPKVIVAEGDKLRKLSAIFRAIFAGLFAKIK